MRSGWTRFGAFLGTVGALVALVVVATRDEQQTVALLIAEVLLIGGLAYMLTFLFWPRNRARHPSAAHPSHRVRSRPVPEEPRLRTRDPRPVLVIGDRPAGSRPASEVHERDALTLRNARGRRPGPRAQSEFRWPAQR